MTLEELHRTVVEGFSRIDERFARIEDRLAQNDARWEQNAGSTAMTVETFESGLPEETEQTLPGIDGFAARMEPLLRTISETNAELRRLIATQERLRQPPEKRS